MAIVTNLVTNSIPQQRRARVSLSDDERTRLCSRYAEGVSQTELAREFAIPRDSVKRILRQSGLSGVKAEMRRDRHRGWKGGIAKDSGGYVLELVEPTDPLVGMAMNRGGTLYCLQHRLVVARALGRPLTRSETVHHINGRRDDNRLENLQLRQGRHGNGVVFACVDCGSHNVQAVQL